MNQKHKRLYLILAAYLALALIGLTVYLVVLHADKVKDAYNNDINEWIEEHITGSDSYRLDAVVFTTFAYGTESGQKPQTVPDVSDSYELTVFKDTQTVRIEYISRELYYGSNNSSNSTTAVGTSSYLSISGSTVTIWLSDGSGGYTKQVTDDESLAQAISDILFSDAPFISDGTVVSAELNENELSADKETLTLKRSVDSEAWFLPYELLSGKTSATYPALILEFTYATDTKGMRTCTVSDIKTLYAFAYSALHDTEYSNVYIQNSLSYTQTLTIDFSDTGLATAFTLPD